MDLARRVVAALERIAGRIVFNGWPTGVAVVRRWLVPFAYQNFPPELRPTPLR